MVWIKLGALMMFLSVALGAFGAHGLKGKLSDYAMDVYNKAVFYQVMHALALFVVAWLSTINPKAGSAGVAFLAGIVLFSGSLYVLALTGIKGFGAITPIGGVCFLIGWVLIFCLKT